MNFIIQNYDSVLRIREPDAINEKCQVTEYELLESTPMDRERWQLIVRAGQNSADGL